MPTPNLRNKDHNAFVQDYIVAMMNHTKEIADTCEDEARSKRLLKDCADLEGIIDLVQEYWGRDGDTGFDERPRPTMVKRVDAIHQLFNVLHTHLSDMDMHQSALDYLAKFELLIPNEDLATWING